VAASDVTSGQAFFGIDNASQGKLIRYNMKTQALLDVTFLTGFGNELSMLPAGFIFRSSQLVFHMSSIYDLVSYYFSSTNFDLLSVFNINLRFSPQLLASKTATTCKAMVIASTATAHVRLDSAELTAEKSSGTFPCCLVCS